ncbi:MAG: hypothetical protein VCF24_06910 [Candidatus Latescibacterota bacterium]
MIRPPRGASTSRKPLAPVGQGLVGDDEGCGQRNVPVEDDEPIAIGQFGGILTESDHATVAGKRIGGVAVPADDLTPVAAMRE